MKVDESPSASASTLYAMNSRNPCAESMSAPPRFACAEPNSPNFMGSASPFRGMSGLSYLGLDAHLFRLRLQGWILSRPLGIQCQLCDRECIRICLLVRQCLEIQHTARQQRHAAPFAPCLVILLDRQV